MRRFYIDKRTSCLLRIGAWLLIVCGALLFADSKIRPVIKSMASYQARVYATVAINDAIEDALLSEKLRYDQIVTVTVDAGGTVSSIQTDMVALNLLRAKLINTVSERIAALEQQTIRVPIGTLMGGQIFSGRGPRVEFKILPAGFVHSQIKNNFQSAGINQTRHQIFLEVNATIIAIVPGYSTSTEVITNVCLAETVIIGVVPEAFTLVTGDDRSTIDHIFDHQAAVDTP
jgi:sporulation protein YunB